MKDVENKLIILVIGITVIIPKIILKNLGIGDFQSFAFSRQEFQKFMKFPFKNTVKCSAIQKQIFYNYVSHYCENKDIKLQHHYACSTILTSPIPKGISLFLSLCLSYSLSLSPSLFPFSLSLSSSQFHCLSENCPYVKM